MAGRIIDLSVELEPGTPVFVNYPPVEITIFSTTESPAPPGRRSLNSSRLAIGLHCGTHMDAPFHFIAGGRTIEAVPLERCVGPALRVNLPHHGPQALITTADLEGHREALHTTRKLILNTGWHRRWGEPAYFTDHPVITPEAAHFLVECGVHLVGIDTPSVDVPPHPSHPILLGNEVLIVENLTNLDQIPGERFRFAAFPLKIVGRDGSPVRAIAMEL